ncbi:MAG: hypothetical protein KF824_04030 [Fimbriimonadaceae bacterium]|nr:MAG: hypothetical protein KF824_04030 [Fimbriimonadaceae bacterium]
MKVLFVQPELEFLKERLSGFNGLTARGMGLDGKGPSTIMRESRDMKFDVVVTTDRSLRFPMGSEGWTFGILFLEISPLDEATLTEQLDRIRSGILGARAGEVSTVRWPR